MDLWSASEFVGCVGPCANVTLPKQRRDMSLTPFQQRANL